MPRQYDLVVIGTGTAAAVAAFRCRASGLRGKGVSGGESRLDWRELIAFKRTFTDPRPPQLEEDFAKRGIDAFHSRARFRGPRTIEAGGETLEARFILIATGAVPVRLGI